MSIDLLRTIITIVWMNGTREMSVFLLVHTARRDRKSFAYPTSGHCSFFFSFINHDSLPMTKKKKSMWVRFHSWKSEAGCKKKRDERKDYRFTLPETIYSLQRSWLLRNPTVDGLDNLEKIYIFYSFFFFKRCIYFEVTSGTFEVVIVPRF